MATITPRCFSCKNRINKIEGNSYGTCKAFAKGILYPYGFPPTYTDKETCFQEPEISIRYHRVFTPIQENNYLYEDNEESQYQLTDLLTSMYFIVHSTLYWLHGTREQAIETMEKHWIDTINLDKQKVFEWVLSRNQSLEAKILLEFLFGYEEEKERKSKFTEMELLEQWASRSLDTSPKESTEEFLNRMFQWIETKGLPDDFCIYYTDDYAPYIYDFLRFNFTVVLYDLGEVSMQNKGIEVLPENVGELTNVRFLDISRNQLRALPATVGKLQFLERLDVYGNQLEILPDEVCNLLCMNRLDLYHNALVALPTNIGKLENLQWLGLNHNQLTSLPASVTNLQKLEGLYCTDNELTAFPESLSALGNLQYLYLSRNQLCALSTSVGKMQSLRWLGLGGNQLTTLPEELFSLPALEWLDLRDNPIAESEQERIKAGLPNIEILF